MLTEPSEKTLKKKQGTFSLRNIILAVALAASIFGLYLLSRNNYLLFHGTVEMFTIVIAFAIFSIAWNTRRISDNHYMTFIGMAFLFIGGLDLIHTLAYKGMGIFPNVGANLATQLWIATRYVFAFSMLVPLLFIIRKIKSTIIIAAYSGVSLLLLLSLFYWNIFPQAYVDGIGLTTFKVASEYVISAILLLSIVFLIKNRRQFGNNVFRLLLAGMATAIATEMSFTLYTDVYGIANMVGHLLDFTSFYLIYKALVETSLSKPYELLFRNLKRSETDSINRSLELSQLNISLEKEVAERKKADAEKELVVEFLRIANTSTSTPSLVETTIEFFQKLSGCEAVGIRLKDNDDYPYYETRGFPPEHVMLENKLCSTDNNGTIIRDFEGNPVYECMCGNILCGRFDISKDFFTAKGSFWVNSTTNLLATTSDSDRQTRTRNRCNGEGYESVAILALKIGKSTIGLLQLNDKHQGKFSLDMIQMWERIADHLALALSKSIAEETAHQRAEQLERLQVKLEEKASEVEEYAANMEKLAQDRLRKLQDSERLAAIGATAGMVGHDLRNPLQAISGDLYFAKKDVSKLPECSQKANLNECIDTIQSSVDYINKIVQDLQDFARPIKLNMQETDLEVMLSELLLKMSLPDEISATFSVADDSKIIVTDSLIMKRILNNLTSNAVQAMPNGGKLIVTSCRNMENVVVSVEDTGVGIPEEARDKIFTPMFTTKAKGQGFGLAVVKRMTEALGGTITFESEIGKGTKFIITIPIDGKQISN